MEFSPQNLIDSHSVPLQKYPNGMLWQKSYHTSFLLPPDFIGVTVTAIVIC